MSKRVKVLYGGYITFFYYVFVACLFNEAVFHICVWMNKPLEISWQVLRTVQIITVSPVTVLLLISLCCKVARREPFKTLSLERKAAILSTANKLDVVYFALFILCRLHHVYARGEMEEYRLLRAHGTLLLLLDFALHFAGYLLGLFGKNIYGTGDYGTGDGSLSQDENRNE